MSNFSFPPPPPPPPPPAQQRPAFGAATQGTYSAGARGGGRGGFQNVRGNGRGRGRGVGRGGYQGFQGVQESYRHGHDRRQQPPTLQTRPKSDIPRVARTPAPPAVPRFGGPIVPVEPRNEENPADAPPAKKRKVNQLGLTPHTDGNEESEEEAEVDEEATFAAGSSGPLRVEYKGQTLLLSTATELKAWITQRKSNFPTARKIAERKLQAEKLKEEKEAQWKQREEERRREREERRRDGEERGRVDGERRKEEERERQALLRKKVVESMQRRKSDANANDGKSSIDEPTMSPAPTSQPQPQDQTTTTTTTDTNPSNPPPSPPVSPSPPPEETTSKRPNPNGGPQRIPPPPKRPFQPPATDNGNKPPCRHFLLNGACKFGDRCRYSHVVATAKGSGAGRGEQGKGRGEKERGKGKGKGRKGLYERMLEQQRKGENKVLLAVIKRIGAAGLLD